MTTMQSPGVAGIARVAAAGSRDTLRMRAVDGMRALLTLMGADGREVLERTPERAVDALMEIGTPGLGTPTIAQLLRVQFSTDLRPDLVITGPVAFTSLCEHHMMPFSGDAWMAYLPAGGMVVGLSKLPRLVEAVAARPQLQERMTETIAQALRDHVSPDAGCVITARHGCLGHRGAKHPETSMRTVSVRGRLGTDLRGEFLAAVMSGA